jgi:membrane fusion protein (multidrug efflux system)
MLEPRTINELTKNAKIKGIGPGTVSYMVGKAGLLYILLPMLETLGTSIWHSRDGNSDIDTIGDTEFTGKVYRFSAATGAKFSILPPDNATGNFVKVIQRVPVKIKIDQKNNSSKLLRPGMSVKVSVQVD